MMRAMKRPAIALLLGVAFACVAAEAPLASLPRHVALDQHRHVSGQPTPAAIAELKASGITTVIDLRPDAETPDLDEKAETEKAGLKYLALPIAGAADLTPANVTRFDQLLKQTATDNVLIHCASGNRVGAMLALQARWLQGKSAEESLAIGQAAGMTGLTAEVQKLLQATPQQSPVIR
jgi:uncharacterized protein (TIGR01244 family)